MRAAGKKHTVNFAGWSQTGGESTLLKKMEHETAIGKTIK